MFGNVDALFAKMEEENHTLSEVRSLFGFLAGSELSGMTDDKIKNAIHEEKHSRHNRAE